MSPSSTAATDWHTDARNHVLNFDPDAVRRVQLFHSVPHEVGHWADMFEHVELPSGDDIDLWQALWDRYWQRPTVEREEYAHRYAEEQIARLGQTGEVPFERILDRDALTAEGLRLQDFILEADQV